MRHLFAVAALTACVAGSTGAQSRADSLTERLREAVQRWERGDRPGAAREFQTYIDIYNARVDRLTSGELVAVAVAVTYLGVDDPQLFKDAMKAYDRAIAADPDNLDARVRLAELFLDKYNGAEAKRTLVAALARNPSFVPTLVAEARRRDFDGERDADSLLNRALELEPENAPARLLRARFLADAEDFAGAARETDRALRARPDDAAALAFRAALHRVTGDTAAWADARNRFAALYPREAGVQVATAQLLGRVRQYAAAASASREGIERDPKNWRAHALLGTNLLRLGDIAAGRRSLETAFAGDPYDIWTKNTLDLLDTFGEYENIETDRFRFVIERAEAQILSLYLRELLEKAYVTFSGRYGFTPAAPVRVEVYRSHADFAVRTVGLAGLGALGVSFGNVIAFDSPAAKDAGGFNWASTAWHELAHTFTLGATEQRIPRWLSEGLSVFEERRARPGWGQNVTPAFLLAYEANKLVPASRLNDGFIRPAYPQQVLFSYYQASLVCEMIVRDFGEAALTRMLQGYRAGQSNAQVIQRVLGLDAAGLDRKFDAYLRERFGRALAALADKNVNVEQYLPADELVARADARAGSYQLQLAVGRALIARREFARAIPVLERARSLLPEYGGADGPYPALVRARQATGDLTGAAATLAAMAALGDMPYETHLTLVDLQLETGDTVRAATALENAMFMNPFDIAQHERLADLLARSGDRQRAVRERAAVVALKPVDRAEALYRLALAYRDAGDARGAKRSVLEALEEAPHFERAQELLLALVEKKP